MISKKNLRNMFFEKKISQKNIFYFFENFKILSNDLKISFEKSRFFFFKHFHISNFSFFKIFQKMSFPFFSSIFKIIFFIEKFWVRFFSNIMIDVKFYRESIFGIRSGVRALLKAPETNIHLFSGFEIGLWGSAPDFVKWPVLLIDFQRPKKCVHSEIWFWSSEL